MANCIAMRNHYGGNLLSVLGQSWLLFTMIVNLIGFMEMFYCLQQWVSIRYCCQSYFHYFVTIVVVKHIFLLFLCCQIYFSIVSAQQKNMVVKYILLLFRHTIDPINNYPPGTIWNSFQRKHYTPPRVVLPRETIMGKSIVKNTQKHCNK